VLITIFSCQPPPPTLFPFFFPFLFSDDESWRHDFARLLNSRERTHPNIWDQPVAKRMRLSHGSSPHTSDSGTRGRCAGCDSNTTIHCMECTVRICRRCWTNFHSAPVLADTSGRKRKLENSRAAHEKHKAVVRNLGQEMEDATAALNDAPASDDEHPPIAPPQAHASATRGVKRAASKVGLPLHRSKRTRTF
jgi:hypothetical protein